MSGGEESMLQRSVSIFLDTLVQNVKSDYVKDCQQPRGMARSSGES